MTTTGRIIRDATNHFNTLVQKHKKLHDKIEKGELGPGDQDFNLTDLKKQKLHTKDELETLRTALLILSKQ